MVVLAICILIACYNSDFVHDPVWLAVMFIAGAAKFFGARLFYRGYFQAS
jgi:hypothetical protein